MAKFKVGDKVRALECDERHEMGEKGTIDNHPRSVPSLVGVCWDKSGEIYPEWETRIELIKGGKMKENKKVYPKRVYVAWGCPTNEDRGMAVGESINQFSHNDGGTIAVYELKKLIKVTMRPYVTDVKE